MRTLQAKIFLVVVGLVVSIGGCAFVLQAQLYRDYEWTMAEALDASLAETIARELAASSDRPRAIAAWAKPTFSHLMSINPSIEIYLLSGTGEVEAFTAPPAEVKRQRVDLGPVRAFIANQFVYPLLGDNPKDPASQKVFSAALLDPANADAGYVYVILGGTEFDEVAKRIGSGFLIESGAILSGAALLAGLVAMLYMRLDVVRKLSQLIESIGKYRAGGLIATRQTAVGGASLPGDEIDAVAHAFAEMTAQIEMLVAKLDSNDRSRRELIANVSHDLRTPIASARAHLETLVVKQAALSPQQRADHLDIATRQIERLQRLAEELFELGKLETPNARMTIERFPVAELVQDVLQKFQIEARTRGLSLSADLGTEMPHIYGDIALIERVLDNLIENAIRHTPHGGAVDISMAAQKDYVVITVLDTGEGIAAEHLPHIFERFYRVRPEDGCGGSGLGLAIVRRIVDMHGGAVTAESKPGAGARFSVRLPAEGSV